MAVLPRRRRSRRRGAALILVVLVVAALLAIGAPFVLSMRHAERAGRTAAAAARARLLARGAQARALARLLEEHEDPERRARERRVAGADEDVDDLEDVLACGAELEPPAGVRPFAPAGPAGAWSTHVDVVDLRARLDPLTAPRAVAHLLGVTVLTAPLSYDEADSLQVEDAGCFADDGDPATYDGLLLVDGELVAYRERAELPRRRRDDPPRWELRGLLRRVFFTGGPPPDEQDDRRHHHPVGSLVEDGRLLKLAADPLVHPAEVRGAEGVEGWSGAASLRRVADWSLGAVNAREALRGAGVTARELRQWGIGREQLVAAGLDPDVFDPRRRPGASSAEGRRRERELEAWDVPVERLWRFGGERALRRAHRWLTAADGAEERRDYARGLRGALSSREDGASRYYRDWLRDEARRQLAWIAQLRAEAPDLETIGRVELARDLRPFVTGDAPPVGAAWSEWFPARPHPPGPLDDWQNLEVVAPRGLAAGRLLRVRARGRPGAEVVRTVGGVTDQGVQVEALPLDLDHGDPHDPTPPLEVSVRLPSPVCVRTAPREVLEALLVGLQGRIGQRFEAHVAHDVVTPSEARVIADALLRAPPRDLFELKGLLRDLLAEEAISLHDHEAALQGLIDPGAPLLLAPGSAPVAFTTGEVFEVQAVGAVVDDAGLEVARAATREVVRAAPPTDLVWSIDTQAEWADRLWTSSGKDLLDPAAGGGATLLLPHARSAFVETGPVHLGPLLPRAWARPSHRHAPGEAELRALRGVEVRCQKGAAEVDAGRLDPGALRQEDWADQPDGVALAAQALRATELPRRRVTSGETGRSRDALGPGGLRGWFRLDRPAAPGRQHLFDGGLAEGVDRLSLFLEEGELVLAADDEALDARESAALGLSRPRATEVRWRPPSGFTAGEWYHVAAQWRGADRGDLALVVDGQLVGRDTLGGRLERAIDPFALRLVLEDASGLPPFGLVRLGPGRRTGPAGERGLGGDDRDLPRATEEVVGELLRYERVEGSTLVLEAEPPLPAAAMTLVANGWRVASVTPPLPGGLPLVERRQPLRGSGLAHDVTLEAPRRGRAPPETATFRVWLGGEHVSGANVVPYGYRSHLARSVQDAQGAGGQLTRGGARLVDPLPGTTPATLLYAPVAGYGVADAQGERQLFPQVVDAAAVTLPVLWAGAWPDPPSGPPPGASPAASGRERPAGLRGGPNLTGGWPDQGVVRITTVPWPTFDAAGRPATPSPLAPSVERVRYTGIDRARGLLLGCTRGVEGTTPAPHCLLDSVVLESVRVTDPTDYPARPTLAAPRVLVSLAQRAGQPGEAVEWLSVQRCGDPRLEAAGLLLLPARGSLSPLVDAVPRLGEGERPSGDATPTPLLQALVRVLLRTRGDLGPAPGALLVDDPDDPDHGQPWKEVLKRWEPSRARAARRTRALEHAAGAAVVPTFALRAEDAGEAGPGDVVTVTDDLEGAPAREEARVVHAAPVDKEPDEADAGTVDRGPPGGWLVAFDDFVARTYRAEDGARLARWPVGDLRSVPALVLGRASPTARRDAPGACDARLDDLVVWQDEEDDGARSVGADASGAALRYRPFQRALPQEGLLKVDDEALDLRDVRWGGATDPTRPPPAEATALRGALGTRPGAHAPETQGWRLSWPGRARVHDEVGYGRVVVGEQRGELRSAWGYLAVDRGADARAAGPWAGVLPFDAFDGSTVQRPLDLLGRPCLPAAFGAPAVEPAPGDLVVDLPFRLHDRPAATTLTWQGVLWQAARELPGGYLLKVDWDEQLPTPYAEVRVAVRTDGEPAWDGPRATAPGQTGVVHVLDDPRAPNLLLLPCERVEVRVTLTFKPGALKAGAWKRGAVLSALRVHYRQATRTLRAEEGE